MADAEVRISIQDTALVSRGQPETARWQDSRNLFERNKYSRVGGEEAELQRRMHHNHYETQQISSNWRRFMTAPAIAFHSRDVNGLISWFF